MGFMRALKCRNVMTQGKYWSKNEAILSTMMEEAVSELPQTERSKIQDELDYISRKQERLNAFSQEVPKLRSEYRSSSSYERTNFWGNSTDEQLTKAMAEITSLKRCFIALLEEIDSKRAACTPN